MTFPMKTPLILEYIRAISEKYKIFYGMYFTSIDCMKSLKALKFHDNNGPSCNWHNIFYKRASMFHALIGCYNKS